MLVLESPWIFSRFSRPRKSLKTDTVLLSPWIFVWKSLKVLEFDFLKQCAWTSDFQCNHPITIFLKIFQCGIHAPLLSVCFRRLWSSNYFWLHFLLILESSKLLIVNWTCLDVVMKVLILVNAVLLEYPSNGPWKVLEFDFDIWARTMGNWLGKKVSKYYYLCIIKLIHDKCEHWAIEQPAELCW